MIKFVGDFNARVDDKGRLVFPSVFKAAMGSEPLRFIVKKDSFDPCLTIYTEAEWERKSEEMRARLNFHNPEHNRFWRLYMSNRAAIEPDSKLGRITIPKPLLDAVHIHKDVVFKGLDHKIELWGAEEADAAFSGIENEAEMEEKILGGD